MTRLVTALVLCGARSRARATLIAGDGMRARAQAWRQPLDGSVLRRGRVVLADRPEPWHTGAVNRRLRLALLLAALAAAGPSVSAPQAFDPSRTGVSIAWFRVTPASRPQLEIKQAGFKARLEPAQANTCAEPDVVLPDTLRVHSLFQRPPPLHS